MESLLRQCESNSGVSCIKETQTDLLKCLSYFLAVFEEPEDPSNRSFFSEIISSISDVKFSHSGRYMMTRDYLSVKIWDLNMENRPVETYQVLGENHVGWKLQTMDRG